MLTIFTTDRDMDIPSDLPDEIRAILNDFLAETEGIRIELEILAVESPRISEIAVTLTRSAAEAWMNGTFAATSRYGTASGKYREMSDIIHASMKEKTNEFLDKWNAAKAKMSKAGYEWPEDVTPSDDWPELITDSEN